MLEIEAGGASDEITQPKRDDAEEVLNYRTAMRMCESEIAKRPFSQQMLRSAHSVLMQGVRGRDKSPGSYRKEQNWIGPSGCTVEEASFVPIALEHLQSGMDSWEQYLNSDSEPDILVQLAILHIEFEALHPFKDGNGRLGRMLIPLFLYQKGLLASPDFYMSGYMEMNREEYQEKLRAVSRDGKWTEWCAYFLRGVKEQAAENESKAREILDLYDQVKNQVVDLTRSQHSIRAVDFMFQTPIFTAPMFTINSEVPKPTANRMLTVLRDEGILVTIKEAKGRRPGIHAFKELLNITEGRDVF